MRSEKLTDAGRNAINLSCHVDTALKHLEAAAKHHRAMTLEMEESARSLAMARGLARVLDPTPAFETFRDAPPSGSEW